MVTHPSAPFSGCAGVVGAVDFPFPFPVVALVDTPEGAKPCWYRLDEIDPPDVDAPAEQIPVVTG